MRLALQPLSPEHGEARIEFHLPHALMQVGRAFAAKGAREKMFRSQSPTRALPLFLSSSAPLRLCAFALKGVLVTALFAPTSSLAPAADLPQIDVFTSGQEGYHTYRTPALVVTTTGTLLAICEGRKTGRGDHGDLDLVQKRSTDGGKSWGPLALIHEE